MKSSPNTLRFNPDGECLPVAIDFITNYLDGILYKKSDIQNISSLKQIMQFLKKNGFNFVINLPLLSFVSPVNLLMLIKFNDHFLSKKKFIKTVVDIEKNMRKFTLLYNVLAHTFYQNSEYTDWSHFIVTYKDNERFCIFDPLYDILSLENDAAIKITSEHELNSILSVKILIWK